MERQWTAEPKGSSNPKPCKESVTCRDKFIVGSHEPILVFCAYMILIGELDTEHFGQAPASAIRALYAGADPGELVSSFQLQPRTPADLYLAPSIDILCMCTRVGGVGITLTSSDLIVLLGVDKSNAEPLQQRKSG